MLPVLVATEGEEMAPPSAVTFPVKAYVWPELPVIV
jgi:hypothetical protein